MTILTLLLNPTGGTRRFRLPPPHAASRRSCSIRAAPEAAEPPVTEGTVEVSAAHSAVLVLRRPPRRTNRE